MQSVYTSSHWRADKALLQLLLLLLLLKQTIGSRLDLARMSTNCDSCLTHRLGLTVDYNTWTTSALHLVHFSLVCVCARFMLPVWRICFLLFQLTVMLYEYMSPHLPRQLFMYLLPIIADSLGYWCSVVGHVRLKLQIDDRFRIDLQFKLKWSTGDYITSSPFLL